MAKEIIATDIDEVLFPFVQEFAQWHNQEYGSELEIKDFNSYDFEHVLGVSVPETVHRVHNFISQSHGHLDVPPLSLAQEAIAGLSINHRLVAITARHPDFESTTAAYLARYFSEITDLTLVGHKETVSVLRSKADVCREIGAFVLIDDSLTHVQSCVDTGIRGVLFGDYPWQPEVIPVDIEGAHGWSDVLGILNGKS